jgi:hypothetical protein
MTEINAKIVAAQFGESSSLRVLVVATLAIALICILSASVKKRSPRHNGVLFILISIVVISSTGLLVGAVLDSFLNASPTGLSRRQSQIEYWACGVQLATPAPNKPFSSSNGEGAFYDYGDGFARFQGVIDQEVNAPNLSNFQRAIGGSITATSMVLPLSPDVVSTTIDGDSPDPSGVSRIDKFVSSAVDDQSTITLVNGATCGSTSSVINIFGYSVNESTNTYMQKKYEFPSNLDLGKIQNISDCIIVEFDSIREKTDRLCSEIGDQDAARCQDFRLLSKQEGSCDLRQVSEGGTL